MSARALGVPLLACIVALAAASSAIARPYTIKPGDTLERIARTELGDANAWRDIAEHNGIQTPDVIQVGQVIDLPTMGDRSIAGATEGASRPASTATITPAETSRFELPFDRASSVPMLAALTPDGSTSPALVWTVLAAVFVACLAIDFAYRMATLRFACWLVKFETTWRACAGTTALQILGLILVMLVAAVVVLAAQSLWGMLIPLVLVPVVFVAPIRRVFKCEWRTVVSVATLLFATRMAISLALHVVVFCVGLAIDDAPPV